MAKELPSHDLGQIIIYLIGSLCREQESHHSPSRTDREIHEVMCGTSAPVPRRAKPGNCPHCASPQVPPPAHTATTILPSLLPYQPQNHGET